MCVRSKCLLLYWSILLSLKFDMQHDHIQIFFTPLNRFRVGVRTEYVLALCTKFHVLQFDMRHGYFQKKNIFTFDPTPGAKGACMDGICPCIVLYLPFPLI